MLNFKTLSEDRIRETFNYNTDYIISNLIPEQTLEELKHRDPSFVLVAFDEIFVRYPSCPDYYVSSYGRCISVRRGYPHLKKEPADGSGHIIYKFYEENSSNELNISAQRAVADIYLPNFWPNLTRRQLETHHLDPGGHPDHRGRVRAPVAPGRPADPAYGASRGRGVHPPEAVRFGRQP